MGSLPSPVFNHSSCDWVLCSTFLSCCLTSTEAAYGLSETGDRGWGEGSGTCEYLVPELRPVKTEETSVVVEVLLYVHRNRRFIRDGEPRTSTSTFTQLLSSENVSHRQNNNVKEVGTPPDP